MTVYGGNEMIPGAPRKLSFEVMMDPMVSMVNSMIDFDNIFNYEMDCNLILL